MSKELPYFKFEPNQWENGNIQMCSREQKGLFLDLCSMYWSRLGDLPVKLAVQKLCAGNATALDSLCEENIIAVQDGFIRIDFLEEQLLEFENISIQNSKNAIHGWEKRRKIRGMDAVASNPQCESDAIRGEEIREDKIKEEKIKKYSNVPPTIKEIEDRIKERGITKFTAEKFNAHYTANGWMVGRNKMKNWDAALTTWNNQRYEDSTGTNKRNIKRVNDYWNTPGTVPSV